MENFYYAAIYDLLGDPGHDASKLTALRGLKAKIIRLNSSHRKILQVDTSDQDRLAGEDPSLYHLIKPRRRRENQLIKEIVDDDGILQTTSASILKVSAVHFRKKFQPIRSKVQNLQLTSCDLERILQEINYTLAEPISIKELWTAISKRKSSKAPGPDDICLEFFKVAWEVVKLDLLHILNSMFLSGIIVGNQLQGHIVCLPKNSTARRTDDYRPLTFMNSGYKILTRIVANTQDLPAFDYPLESTLWRAREIHI
jgi:hypothetical protein